MPTHAITIASPLVIINLIYIALVGTGSYITYIYYNTIPSLYHEDITTKTHTMHIHNVRRRYTQAQLQYSFAFPKIYSLLHAYSYYNNRLTLGDYKSDIALVGTGSYITYI